MDPQIRLDGVKYLVKDILESRIIQRSNNAELRTLMLGLKTSLDTSEPIALRVLYENLRVANTLGDQLLIWRLAHLAVRTYPSGNFLLKSVIAGSLDNIAKCLVEGYWAKVGQGEFEWLYEAALTDCSTGAILSALRKPGPWVKSDDVNPEGDHADELDPSLHQDHCVHVGGPAIDQLRNLAALQPSINWESHALRRDESMRVISAYCGLAGVIPDWKTGTVFLGRVTFQGTSACVSFSDGQDQVEDRLTLAEEAEKQGNLGSASSQKLETLREQQDPIDEVTASHWEKVWIGRSKPAAQSLQIKSKLKYVLTGSEIEVIDLLKQATMRLCSAATVLQRSKLCCNTFTLVVFRDPSNSDHVVDLVSISFQTLKDLRDAVVALQKAIRTEYREGLPSLPLDAISRCSTISRGLLRIFAPSSTPESTILGWFSDSSFSSQLHICSLVTQFLGLGLAFYTQAHVGPYSPFFLEYPLTDLTLTGTMDSGVRIRSCLRELTCLRGMVGGPVFVFALLDARPLDTWQTASQLSYPLDLRGIGIDIADTWGPGLLISRPKAQYGHQVCVIEIGGGVIRRVESRSSDEALTEPLYHWSPRYESRFDSDIYRGTQATFSCWDTIRIGETKTRLACPLDLGRYRQESQHFLSNLGTVTEYWELAERQFALQAGFYALFQLGNTYARKLGTTVKQQIIEQWSSMPNIHILDSQWGLQVSLCTGVAKRVSLRTLIEDSIFTHIDTLHQNQWQKMLPMVQEAFRGSIDFGTWVERLAADEKSCLIAVIAYALELLRYTGVDREGRALSVLWPHKTSASYGIKFKCEGLNGWARILHDTESCATFAAVTPLCFEGHNHKCRNMVTPSWQAAGGFLSTAMCRDLTAEKSKVAVSSSLRLEDGQKYWIGKTGGDYLVVVRRTKDGDVRLFVKHNPYPKIVSQKVLKLSVIRERPSVDFHAEDVVVWGGEDVH